ncbi:hypothetical protein [Bowmanella dokdonensis]|uniref:Uncharacterized protein n=1 Tax=Bowmanella dokdonensis TaxID=751969 RepID=A0A939DR42_9ALTE|nr:hypothetical protein [Bowmanella dokdonensis]MBN7827433.1 hypothetical protein [Bowmanella dokdonensis]
MNKQNFERDLQRRITELQKDRQPQRDLWPGIEYALNRQQEEVPLRSGKPFLGLAAAVAVIGFVGWLSFSPSPVGQGDPSLVAALSQQHQQQKQALLASFADQPALTQNWQEQLDELDGAAEAIKQALEEDPNNLALLKMLQQVYQQQIDLIEKVHAPKWQQI